MTRHISSVLAALLLVAGASRAAGAQALPSVTAPKQAAMRAAAAVNAHTDAETMVEATPTATPTVAAPAAARPAAKRAAPKRAAAKPVAPAAPAAPRPDGDSAKKVTVSVAERGAKGEVAFSREVFSYDVGARRDPFVSLIANGDLRPLFGDLRLVAVAYDPTGRNSVAVMRDVSSAARDQYRVRVGQTLGRMRVAQIHPKAVTFTIEEFGFSRQEVLALSDTTKARTQ